MIRLRESTAIAMALAFVFSCAGCATIVTGTWQKMPISSEPAGAALCVDGKGTYTTPVTIKLKRDSDHVLIFTKDRYEPQEVKQ